MLKVLRGVPQFALQRYEPPRGISERVGDLINDSKVLRGVAGAMDDGLKLGADEWYNTSALRRQYIDQLGEEEGARQFALFMDMIAATSPRSTVDQNIRNGTFYRMLALQGKLPEVGTKMPAPYGHLAQRLHQMNALTVDGGGWDVIKNPKPPSFSQNLQGNEYPVTVDSHATKLPAMLAKDPRWLATSAESTAKGGSRRTPLADYERGALSMEDAIQDPTLWVGMPNKNEYAALEDMYRGIANKKGLTPAQGQASAWTGGGKITGLKTDARFTFEELYNLRLGITAAKTGKTKAQVARDVIAGKMALL